MDPASKAHGTASPKASHARHEMWTGSISDEATAYQTYLEATRAHPDNQQLADDLRKARAALEIAWLTNQHNLYSTP